MQIEVYLLDQYVSPVEDGDAKFEGESHHGAKSTWQTIHHTVAIPKVAVIRRQTGECVFSYLCWHLSSEAPSLQLLDHVVWLVGTASSASPFPFPVWNDNIVSTTPEYKCKNKAKWEKSVAPQTFSPFLPHLPLLHLQHSSERESRMSNLQDFTEQHTLQ